MKKERHICCNFCGREIEMKEDIPVEDVFSAKKDWGYFSKQDGKRYEFDLCEDCFVNLMKQFRIPPEVTEVKELL